MIKLNKFKLIMLSAMYENGGNTTHRLLDGHEKLFVYPFESQLGTKYVVDNLSSMFPLKYRWPVFPNHLDLDQVYFSIIDEETKVRARTPFVSKFRNADFDFSDEERREVFKEILEGKELNRKNIISAFYISTFEAWKNHKTTGKEKYYVGYSPIIGVDTQHMVCDFENNIHVLHVVRNPFSAYAETKKRAVPMGLYAYINAWSVCQYHALYFSKKYAGNITLLRYEDIIENPKKVLTKFLKKLNIDSSNNLKCPSWNSEVLQEVYPWGTIKIPTPEVNIKTAKTLGKKEIQDIYKMTEMYLKELDYTEIYKQISKK